MTCDIGLQASDYQEQVCGYCLTLSSMVAPIMLHAILGCSGLARWDVEPCSFDDIESCCHLISTVDVCTACTNAAIQLLKKGSPKRSHGLCRTGQTFQGAPKMEVHR